MIESTAELAAAAGATVSLRLERQGVGGYVWSIGQLPPALDLLGEPEQHLDAGVGGGAVLAYRLAVHKPGTHRFTCELRRPWGEGDIAERRKVTVVAT